MVLNVTNCSADMLADEHPFRADEFLQNPPHYVRRSKIFLGCSRCSLYSSFAVRCLVAPSPHDPYHPLCSSSNYELTVNLLLVRAPFNQSKA
ncbi:hypothetical protein KP509_30G053700 [Ceratopteris richardii]|uniref:Uncharacterized protein n=1 Tax=Ceratopteris richardii TaxID=49495 RepID=A0A8T2R476_CERRI|nr:hypothetical protein KP509_30G053700 [Ceratopteris richardii]